MEAEFYVEGGHNGVFKSPQLRVGTSSGITVTGTNISFDAATNTINHAGNGFASFPVNKMINVAGSASNNRVFLVTGVTAGTLTISPSTPVTTEAAGASISVRLPVSSSVTAASSENFRNTNSGVFTHRIPTYIMSRTTTATARAAFFINGTISGTATVYIMRPLLYKKPFKPSLLNRIATDL